MYFHSSYCSWNYRLPFCCHLGWTSIDSISTGSGNDLLPDGIKPLPEPVLSYHPRGITGDPLHSRALAHSRAPLFTQPCLHCSHRRAPGEQWARLCVFTLQGCVQAARLCRGSPVGMWHSHQWRQSHKVSRKFPKINVKVTHLKLQTVMTVMVIRE